MLQKSSKRGEVTACGSEESTCWDMGTSRSVCTGRGASLLSKVERLTDVENWKVEIKYRQHRGQL